MNCGSGELFGRLVRDSSLCRYLRIFTLSSLQLQHLHQLVARHEPGRLLQFNLGFVCFVSVNMLQRSFMLTVSVGSPSCISKHTSPVLDSEAQSFPHQ